MEATAPLADDLPPALESPPVVAAASECPLTDELLDELLRRLREAGL